MSDTTYTCPHCGSEDIAVKELELSYYAIEGFDEDGKVIFGNERNSSHPVNDEPEIECFDCGEVFSPQEVVIE